MKHKERVVWCAAFALLFVLVNLSYCALQYREYKQKLELVYQAAAAEETGEGAFLWAVDILKNGMANDQESRIPARLLEYGYGGAYRDAMRRACVQNCCLMLAGSGALVLFCGLYLCRRSVMEKRRLRNEREDLHRKIGFLRRGDYAQVQQNERLDELGLSSLAEQLQLVTEQAAREKEETKTLVTDISHQLKTPLAALRASVDILQDGTLTPQERQEFVSRCSLQLARLEELASALISISRMETGMIQVQLVIAPIFDTILQAVNRIYPKAQEKNIEIAFEESAGAGEAVLQQDAKWLSEAFINILENAVKYSEPDGTITIITELRQTFLRIEFADHGIGIPRQERNRIFQRFYRGESEWVRKESGSGVGLYLTRKIIEQHCGTIRVKEPQDGKGSIFVVQLPYRDHPN